MEKKLALACGLIAIIYIAVSFNIPIHAIEDPVGPRSFPQILGVAILVVAGLLWLEARGAKPKQKDEVDPALKRRQLIGVFSVSAGALVYALTLESVGYLIMTFLLLIGMLTAFNPGKHPINIAIAVGLSSLLYFGFTKVLGVPLPDGFLA